MCSPCDDGTEPRPRCFVADAPQHDLIRGNSELSEGSGVERFECTRAATSRLLKKGSPEGQSPVGGGCRGTPPQEVIPEGGYLELHWEK